MSFSRPVASDEGGGERDLADVLPTVRDQRPGRPRHQRRAHPRAAVALRRGAQPTSRPRCCGCYVEGKSYQEIAERLQRHVKSIDNALQRIKKKLEGHLQARAVADAG